MARFKFAIRNFAGAIGVFISAFYVTKSGINTMLTIGITAIVAGIFSFGMHDDESGTRLSPLMIFFGIILVLVSTICTSLGKNHWILKYIGAFAVAFVGYYQWIKIGNYYSPTKVLRNIECLVILVFPVLITIGVVLSIFTQKLLLGKGLIIGGAVIWMIHSIYSLVFMDSDGEPDFSKFNFDGRESAYKSDKNTILDEYDVMQIVHHIANLFSRERESLPHSAEITTYVYDDVSENNITYTISGDLRGTIVLTNEQRPAVQAALQRKLQQKQERLMRRTQKELLKYKGLPYPSYNIHVEMGSIDE
ncbi:MAG: hypothetical protein K2J01_02615 [Clostridiales bacterium]|nr:hypothetical protein [Clostridiales bacterium]